MKNIFEAVCYFMQGISFLVPFAGAAIALWLIF